MLFEPFPHEPCRHSLFKKSSPAKKESMTCLPQAGSGRTKGGRRPRRRARESASGRES